MAATIVVFENSKEMAMMCADVCHDWRNQKEIFGSETQKLLDTCTELFHAALRYQGKERVLVVLANHGVQGFGGQR